ncbi:MAG: GNAT family protein [Chitinophagaceae bacterium]
MKIETFPVTHLPNIDVRQLGKADIAEWFAYLSIPEVIKETSWNLKSIQDLEILFNEIESTSVNSPIRLAIVDTKYKRLVGTIGFHTISDVNKTAEIAYDLSPDYWNLGIATSVCKIVTEWGFRNRGWVRIQATVLDTNKPSKRVLLKCGFVFEGSLKYYRMVANKPRNFEMYSRTVAD